MTPILALFRRDLTLAFRVGGGPWLALAFFAGVILLVPLGLGAAPGQLAAVGPGLLWIAAVLAVLLSLDRLFQADYEDGSLEQLLLADAPLSLLVLAKCAAIWVTTGLPLAAASPFFAIQLQVDEEIIPVVALSLLIGTPALTLIGAVTAALTVSVRRGGLLLSLLALPLFVPVVIFGAGAGAAAASGLPYGGALMLLGGLSLFFLVIGPIAAAAALRLHLS
ncbi:MAG: heme exporter protein CcmB [Alphaproteobacteria bacterium]|nr:heme exporter protein CcmB [Alphaproteobacteria bacterium]